MASRETKLVATRVPVQVWETLHVGLLVEGAETMQALLRPVVERYAAELQKHPEVQAIGREVDGYRKKNSARARGKSNAQRRKRRAS